MYKTSTLKVLSLLDLVKETKTQACVSKAWPGMNQYEGKRGLRSHSNSNGSHDQLPSWLLHDITTCHTQRVTNIRLTTSGNSGADKLINNLYTKEDHPLHLQT